MEKLEGTIEGGQKFFGGVFDDNFGLDDELVAGQLGQDLAELEFGGTIGAGGFDVINAELEGAANGGFEVVLIVGGDLAEVEVLPALLIAHAATGEDGH